MKKFLTVILALILLLALSGCGIIGRIASKAASNAENFVSEITENSETSESEINSTEETVSDYSETDTIYGQMTAAEKAAFIESAKLSGTTVTFNADGSTTFVNQDGSMTIQNADGTWTYSDGEGTKTAQFGGEWPENEFTKLVPKPDFGTLIGAVTEEKSFYVMFTDADMNKMRTYIETIKTKGFTIEAETTDETAFGVTALSYTAKDAAGYKIELVSVAGMNSITISKD